MKVKFIKSFDCVKEGDVKDFQPGTAKEMVDAGLAVYFDKKEEKKAPETKELKTAKKTK